jgi:hypothetical protein
MSATAYGVLSWRRELSPKGKSKKEEAPGVKTYIDVLAALVPSEALTFHALALSATTKTETNATGVLVTTITNAGALWWAFWGCIVLSVVLYWFGHGTAAWDRWDFLRVLIPPTAFVGWVMLQKATAFDAVWPNFDQGTRFVVALFVAVVLGGLATWLSDVADKKEKPRAAEHDQAPKAAN